MGVAPWQGFSEEEAEAATPAQVWLYCSAYSNAHLAKHLSDLNQNGTQEETPFSCKVFHALLHGVLRFVASVSLKNH